MECFFDVNGMWREVLFSEIKKEYFLKLKTFLNAERLRGICVYPSENQIFKAFKKTPFEEVRVVILGQDPYHGFKQADGLCFSVPPGTIWPPSLKNIYKEVFLDTGEAIPVSGSLERWARQGVFLLNTILTVCHGEPLSHKNIGWELFTDVVIQKLWEREDPLVFLLWGKNAQDKKKLFKNPRNCHLVLSCAHPSPFSASYGFFGCKHFSKANKFLVSCGKNPIVWGV